MWKEKKRSGVLPLEKILVSIYFKEMFFISRESSVSKLCGIQGDSSSLLIIFPFTFFAILREKKCLKDKTGNDKREVGSRDGSELESKSEEAVEWHRSIIVV